MITKQKARLKSLTDSPFAELVFDSRWYLDHYADAERALEKLSDWNVFEHYAESGRDGRRATPFFDPSWYLNRYPGVTSDPVAALEDFLLEGSAAGRSPNEIFDEPWYRNTYLPGGLPSGFVSGYHHFLALGAASGNDPSPFFDELWYRSEYPDVAAAIAAGFLKSGFHDYIRRPASEERNPNPYFEARWFRSRYPKLARSDRLSYLEYLSAGQRQACSPSLHFDESWYRSTYPEIAAAIERNIYQSAFHHFLVAGATEGHAPSPYFLPHWYRSWYPMVNESLRKREFRHPFEHYRKAGSAAGLSPNIWFNEVWYLHNNPDVAAQVSAGLYACGHDHYLETGCREGRTCSTIFNANHYWETYADARELIESGLATSSYDHFCRYGRKLLHSPTNDFDERWYRREYPDVGTQIEQGIWVDGLHHFLSLGAMEGRLPKPVGDDNQRPQNLTVTRLAQRELRAFLAGDDRLSFRQCAHPAVSIVLICHSNAEFTLRCLRSIEKWAGDIAYEIVVIDNASSDETHALLDRTDGVVVERNSTNQPFLRAANRASQRARGEYLLFLNNDTELKIDAISSAVTVFAGEPDIGAVGGKIILNNGLLQEAGSFFLRNGLSEQYGRAQQPFKSAYMHRRDVPYCSSAFLMTPRELFRELGGFDEAFLPAYCEDADYCLRVWQRGLRVVYNPDSIIVHHEAGSLRNLNLLYPAVLRNVAIFRHRYREYLNALPNYAVAPVSSLDGLHLRCAHLILIPSLDQTPAFVRRLGTVIDGIRRKKGFVTLYPLSPWYGDRADLPFSIPADVEIASEAGAAGLEEFCRSRNGAYTNVITFGNVGEAPLRDWLPDASFFSDRDENALGRYFRSE